jgi:Tfp pilus assembly protein PilE
MGVLLVVVVVLALIAIAAPMWKSYELELRRNPRTSGTDDSC